MEIHINKTYGYVRCSTDRQDCSKEMQAQRISDYCKFKGIELTEILIDDGVSGKIPLYDRPEGSKLKNADTIIAIKLDRLFRNTINCLSMIELWNKQKITLHIIDLGGASIDTKTATGKLFITMLSGFAELERSMISQRTSDALQQKKSNLEKYGRVPYGFKQIINTEKDGKFKIVKNGEMPVINRIFEMRKTTTYDGIAEILNSEGVPTKNRKRWYASTIRYILQNKLYENKNCR